MTVLLTEEEAAARLRIGTRTLRGIRQRGEIAYVPIGRKILYRAEDCERYIAWCVRNDAPPQPTMRRTLRRRSGGIIPFSERER